MADVNPSSRDYVLHDSVLSERFLNAAMAQTLSPLQAERMIEVKARLADGRYRLISEPCPCNQPAEHHLLAKIDRYGLPLDSVLCMNCGTVRTDPFLDAASLNHFYREMYQELYGRTVNIPKYFIRQKAYGEKVLELAQRTKGKGPFRVLEVGCGSGGALSVFHEQGHQVAGCEYDGDLLAHGTSQGVPNLVLGSIDESLAKFGKGAFDIIYLHHVFEHVGAPLAMLETLQTMLAVDGMLIIIVPELEHIDRYPCPAGDALRFFHIAHKYNFTPEGLDLLSRRAGMQATRVTPSDKPTSWTDMPELWVTLSRSTNDATGTVTAGAGVRVLKRLRQTEANLKWRTYTRKFSKKISALSQRLWRKKAKAA